MISSLILLVIGLVLLGRGADVFVDGAVSVARRFNIPSIIIGTTLVAIGTSAPEAGISIVAALRGSDGVSIGNIIGSNITNIFLILGLTAVIGSVPIHQNTKRYELPFVGLITLLLCLIGLWFGTVSRMAALVFLALFVSFILYTICMARKSTEPVQEFKKASITKTIVMIIAGIAALIIGSDLTVNSAIEIANYLHVSERVIGLTVVALGTSLPELVVCVIAAIKHEYDMAIGNIVGSNIFNILFVLGSAALIKPLPFNTAFLTDGAIAMLAITMLMIFTAKNSRIRRFGGIMFLLSYVAYVLYLVA
ncbi:MAG: calcium/sodium antiporter [Alphaproteobacteria bacterium]|nr:calcium/sodium antiporter [Alphaproteobacteria bacterium]